MADGDKTNIYGLVDPRTQELRYVGKANDLYERLKQHIWQRHHQNHRSKWIASVIKSGFLPDIFLIEEVEISKWQESERFWINYFKFIGANLVNHTNGGEGGGGYKHTEEAKRKISESKIGKPISENHKKSVSETRKRLYPFLSIETKNKISKSLLGHPNWSRSFIDNPPMKNPEIIKIVSQKLKGRIVSDETRKRQSEAHAGVPSFKKGIKMSEESKEKMRIAMKKRMAEGRWKNPMELHKEMVEK